MFNFNRSKSVSSTAPRGTRRRQTKKARSPDRRRARFEFLEDRRVLAVLTVNSLGDVAADTSALTLRDAITLVDNAGDPTSLGQASMPATWASQISGAFGSNDSIQFAPGPAGTIGLNQGELLISSPMSITGANMPGVAIDAQNNSGIFQIMTTGLVSLDGLTLTGSSAERGAVYSVFGGQLNVSNSTFFNNTASDTYGGAGGAIDSIGTVKVSNCVFFNNSAVSGGAVSGGDVTVVSGKFVDNSSPLGIGGAILGNNVAVYGSEIDQNSSGGPGGGGAIFGTNVTLNNTNFNANSALGPGGAVYGNNVAVVGGTFKTNSSGVGNGVLGGAGGAIAGRTVSVSGSDIEGNSANGSSGGFGGGVFAQDSATIDGSTIAGNHAARSGGGISGLSTTGLGLTVTGSTLSGNTAQRSGGGVYFGGPLTVDTSTVSDNTAVTGGGGGLDSPVSVTVSDSTISGNTGVNGGGVGSPSATVANSTIAGNTGTYGGGISCITATVSNSTISGNSAGTGGGIWATNASIQSSIVAGNSGNTGSPDLSISGSIAVSHTLVGDNTGSGLTEAPLGAPDSNGNLIGGPLNGDINPLLGPLASNGGPTATMALLPGSPAINAGSNPNNVANDQRGAGYARSVDGAPDMGAYELQTLYTTTTASSSNSVSVLGQSVTFTATVGIVAPETGAPTGTVTFYDGTTQLATVALNAAGQATFTTSKLSVATHTITAVYSGDTNFLTSTSSALNQSVLSAQQEAAAMTTQVRSLVTSGVLNNGNGNSLIATLNAATASLNRGNTLVGVVQLGVFIAKVEVLALTRRLDAADAQTLIADATAAIVAAVNARFS